MLTITQLFQEKFSTITTPTLIVVGERDGKSSSRALENIPTSPRCAFDCLYSIY